MAIITPSPGTTAPVKPPKDNYAIAKYLDITKFISILQRRSLFFCRLDKLEDKFEGLTGKMNKKQRFLYYHYQNEKGLLQPKLSIKELEDLVEERELFNRNYKTCVCVNCWNKYSGENVALWKIYANLQGGIMIKSSINKLKKSFEITNEPIQLSEIDYVDNSTMFIPEHNTNFQLIHKHPAYQYEEEVRLIIEKMPPAGWVYDWSKEEVYEGVFISSDIDLLIDKIIISPYSPKWFFTMVEDLMKKYGLHKKMERSALSPD